jgi:hypothetical protein
VPLSRIVNIGQFSSRKSRDRHGCLVPKPGLPRPTATWVNGTSVCAFAKFDSAPSRLSVLRLGDYHCARLATSWNFRCLGLATFDAPAVSNVRKRVCNPASDQNAVTIGKTQTVLIITRTPIFRQRQYEASSLASYLQFASFPVGQHCRCCLR